MFFFTVLFLKVGNVIHKTTAFSTHNCLICRKKSKGKAGVKLSFKNTKNVSLRYKYQRVNIFLKCLFFPFSSIENIL